MGHVMDGPQKRAATVMSISMLIVRFIGLVAMAAAGGLAHGAGPSIPPALEPWRDWATWDAPHRGCPTSWSDPRAHRCFWPGRLDLEVTETGGTFGLTVVAFHEAWVPLPGGGAAWPQDVRVDGRAGAVLEREGVPHVRMGAGTGRVEGRFEWGSLPQTVRIPASVGLLGLSRDGRAVEAPTWDASGTLWLRRDGAPGSAERDTLAAKAYALLEDGIPMWWRLEVELTVAGKSREEDLGNVLPEGWRLASVASPIPVTVDEGGRARAQVRAGKWTVKAEAFRVDGAREVRLPGGVRPVAAEMLVAFRARPELRTLELSGATAVDASQTYVLASWRDLPVYRWDASRPLGLAERMRGMGDKKPGGLSIERELWLDEDGAGLTFRDRITGPMQQVWRLDVAEGQQLGSVRSGGQGQLVTRNPANNALGFEVRARNLEVEATGRAMGVGEWPATGWRADAEPARVTLHLPPGWRLFALFGSDWVRGDWLTAWTLLDLFLLLVFTLAVFRLRGAWAAALAFAAFGLAYHEPGAPRYPWLALLVPMALARVIPAGKARRVAGLAQGVAAVVLVLFLVPFVGRQVQQALYPQLEPTPGQPIPAGSYAGVEVMGRVGGAQGQAELDPRGIRARMGASVSLAKPQPAPGGDGAQRYSGNLLQDAKARIQTGPGIPEWTWRSVSFGWNGPVQASQTVRAVLVPRSVERGLSVLRTAMVAGLAAMLALRRGIGRGDGPGSGPGSGPGKDSGAGGRLAGAAGAMAGLALAAGWGGFGASGLMGADTAGMGTIPDAATIEKLRERLLAVPDAYPNAASIPVAWLKIEGRKVRVEAEVHAALRVAVPVPGRLPAFSPVAVDVDGEAAATVRRDDGFVWVVVEPGVHRVRLEGWLPSASEWEWSFGLKPRRVRVEAPEWTVAGVGVDGVPEAQVFLAPRLRAATATASYEQQRVESLVAIERRLELGLLWQSRTVVTRLTPPGRAVSLRVPLGPGETVVSQGWVVQDGMVEVRLGAQEREVSWEGTLAATNRLALATRPGDAWVERWQVETSPVWNVGLEGLPPMFEAGQGQLVPTWRPWPGESVGLTVRRPEAVAGATVTVNRALHAASLGRRQRSSTLELALRCSHGEDFGIELPEGAEVTRLAVEGKDVPVRREGGKVMVPLQPGEQGVSIAWKETRGLGWRGGNAAVRLPVEAANVMTTAAIGEDRWVLWATGPQRGPAVRFWGVLALALMGAAALGRVPGTPMGTGSWMLLLVGLTQAPLASAVVSIGWFFMVRWRGEGGFGGLRPWMQNVMQAGLVCLTVAMVGVLLFVVGEGLLGSPRMFILGNESTRTGMRWFEPRSGAWLPECGVYSVSVWWYRLLMLIWALWLAWSLLGWLGAGWRAFAKGGIVRRSPGSARAMVGDAVGAAGAGAGTVQPPPLPPGSGAE